MKTSDKSPIITIVIPVYNRAAMVTRTLDSIAAQGCRDYALVIVDNNSTDTTAEVVKEWAAGHDDLDVTIVSETAPGAAAARNRGLQEVATPWVMFFDSDDLMSPRHLNRITEAIAAHPEAGIIGWDVRLSGLDGKVKILPFEHRDALYHNLFHGTMSTQRYCALTSLVRSAGGWDATVRAWDDIELGTRLLQVSPRPEIVKLDGEPTVDQLSHADSITGTAEWRNAPRYEHALTAIRDHLPREMKHLVELKRVILAACCYREGERGLAHELLNRALEASPRGGHRLMWRVAYHYTRLGGRGIARLLKFCL